MMILITYDVSTETSAGRKRLRRVAKVCLNYGQRVQKSVFECQVNTMEMARLKEQLLQEIDESEDSLRIYRIIEPIEKNREQFGNNRAIDFEGALIV
ncbi:CRISPR-associated endonuclease Cas2 [Methylomicrobium sp. Wu6]|uniref:CRISPR-associated endonuclease Cas2 n=1 Tax=Methylomicrobium TaxID=39773 RepID=UPI002DD69AD5|nr:CRISPR-associated endonuclease Cas2 [Methylomicrobium sp. Wu6]MEC4747662.1 CRISPR-associated endonuclease Cas2 [Methylomicrobium sp. Wu6]